MLMMESKSSLVQRMVRWWAILAVEQSLRKKDRMLILVVRWSAILMMEVVVQSLKKKDRMLMMGSKNSVVQKMVTILLVVAVE